MMSGPSPLRTFESDTADNHVSTATNGSSPPGATVCPSVTRQYHARLYSRQRRQQESTLLGRSEHKPAATTESEHTPMQGPPSRVDNDRPHPQPQQQLLLTPPNLYRTALHFAAENNLHSWWTNLVQLLSNAPFYSSRVALSVPQDTGDPWNGAWGLRAVHNTKQTTQADHTLSKAADYFGQPTERNGPEIVPCFDRLRPFESEPEPLINNPSIRRILCRNAIVVLSREYRQQSSQWHSQAPPDDRALFKSALLESSGKAPQRLSWQTVTVSTPCLQKLEEGNTEGLFNETEILTGTPNLDTFKTSDNADDENDLASALRYNYDEYEQQQPSSWSQSPAPSPAMMDPDVNPFFQSVPCIDDEAFNPVSPESYASSSVPFPLPASNVHSVVHIPLIHPSPTDSAPMTSSAYPAANKNQSAPLAILSLLTPVVPYPSSLVSFLTSLAPFIATSYSNAVECQRLAEKSRQTAQHPSLSRQSSCRRGKRSPMHTPRQPMDFTSDADALAPSASNTTCGHPIFLGSISNLTGSSLETVTIGSSIDHSQYREMNSQQGEEQGMGNSQAQSSASMSTSASSSSSSYSSSRQAPDSFASSSMAALKRPAGQQKKQTELVSDDPSSVYPSSDSTENASSSQSATTFPEGWGNMSSTTEAPSSSLIPPNATTGATPNSLELDTAVKATVPGSTTSSRRSSHNKPRRRRASRRLYKTHKGRIKAAGSSNEDLFVRDSVSRFMSTPKSKFLRLLIDGIPIHVFTCSTTTGQVTWVNHRILQYTGLARHRHLGPGWLSHMHPDDQSLCRRAWDLAFEQGSGFAGEYRLRRFDGVYRFFLWRIVPLRDLKGRIIHWFGTCTDVHDQHTARENSLRQMEVESNERKYRLLAEAIPQIVFTFSPNVGLNYANEKWTAYSGLSYEQSQGFGFMSHVHPEDRVKLQLPELKPPRPTGTVWQVEVRLLGKNEEYRWFLVKTILVNELDTGDLRWFGTCTDINDHKLLEHKLKEAHDAAQKSTESKTRFLSNMSHEIRTPLNGIMGMIHFLLDTELGSEQLDYVNSIQQSAESLLVVINDILDLSKVEAGMMKLEYEPFNLVTLLEGTNELLASLAIQKGLELSYWVDDTVPDIVVGDRVRLRQVLFNLIGNAIKFTSRGEIFTQCSIHEIKEDKTAIKLLFEVVDTGAGFDSEGEAVMFKPFSQVDSSSTRKHGGSGLGLVISRELIELHGGQLKCKSVKGQGSTFYFTVQFGLPNPQSCPDPQSSLGEKSGNLFFETGPEKKKDIQKTLPPSNANRTTALLGSSSFVPSPLAHSKKHSQAVDLPTSIDMLQDVLLNKAATMKLRPPPLRTPSGKQPPEEASLNSAVDRLVAVANMADTSDRPSRKRPQNLSSLGNSAAFLSPSAGVILPPRTPTRCAPLRVLIVSEWPHARETIVRHLQSILKGFLEHDYRLDAVPSSMEAIDRIKCPQAPTYDYIIINLSAAQNVVSLTRAITGAKLQQDANVIILTTPMQRSLIMENAKQDQENLIPHNCSFEFKPLKRSKLNWYFGISQSDRGSGKTEQHVTTPGAPQHRVATQKEVFRRMEADVGRKGFRVMLVEDNLVNRRVLTRYLQRVGLDVEVACDGQEFVHMFLSHPHDYYSLVLCDLFMPVKDGYEATQEVRGWEARHLIPPDKLIPIIALSANVMGDVATKCLECGFSAYISKPVNFATLSDVIRSYLLP